MTTISTQSTLISNTNEKYTSPPSTPEELISKFKQTLGECHPVSNGQLIPGLKHFEKMFPETTSRMPPGTVRVDGDDDLRLGKILLDLDLVTEALLKHAVEMTFKLGIPIGRILFMSGWLTESQLRVAVQIQSVLKDNLLTREVAMEAAELMLSHQITLEKALIQMGYRPESISRQLGYDSTDSNAIRLGELLVAAGIIQPEDLREALNMGRSIGLPLGRCLLLSASGFVSPHILETAVNAQRFIRQGKLTREDAITALQAAARRQSDGEDKNAEPYKHPPMRGIRLGELLVLAGIVSDEQIQYALEMGLVNNRQIGRVLIDLGLISEATIENALKLQTMVVTGTLSPLEAVYALIDFHYHGMGLAQSLSDNSRSKRDMSSVQFTEFLAKTGVMSKKSINEAIYAALKNTHLIARALLLSTSIDAASLQAALRCHFYVQEQLLSEEEAIFVFDHSHRMQLSVEETIEELGITFMPSKVVFANTI